MNAAAWVFLIAAVILAALLLCALIGSSSQLDDVLNERDWALTENDALARICDDQARELAALRSALPRDHYVDLVVEREARALDAFDWSEFGLGDAS